MGIAWSLKEYRTFLGYLLVFEKKHETMCQFAHVLCILFSVCCECLILTFVTCTHVDSFYHLLILLILYFDAFVLFFILLLEL